MKYRIVWTEVALRDLEAILDFVSQRDGVDHSERLLDRLMPSIEGLCSAPNRCRVVPELSAQGLAGYRELLEGSYRVPFRVSGRRVILLGVLDGRRDLEELLIERALRS